MRALSAQCASGWALLFLLCAPTGLVAKDCGKLPKGKNPTMPELAKEIAKASAKHNVPTEIIKAVAWRESGCQQWKPNGDFVYNKTDCGLGMFQLTGATARQFKVERLKTDWKYNLACGVQVLVNKWKRAERRKQVPSDPAARRVLENWYYPVAYYWGGKTESYLRKIFDHLEKRPGRLRQLLGRGVKVTIASDAIKGFKFGDRFVAHPKNRFVDKDGKTHRAPTHLGTTGDPRVTAKLEVLLARGKKAADKGRVKKALKHLGKILKADLDTSHKAAAKVIVARLTKAGEERFKQGKATYAKDPKAGFKAVGKLARDFKGFPLGAKAKAQLKEWRRRK